MIPRMSCQKGYPILGGQMGWVFYYKYFTNFTAHSPNPAQYARAYITLSKWDSTLQDQVEIGHGELFFGELQSEFVYVEVPVEYYSDDTPDLLEISFYNPCDPSNQGASLSVDYVGLVGGLTPTAENNFENDIKIFPNPTSNYLNITLPPELRKTKFRVFDLTGRMVLLENISGNVTEKIELKGFENGMYSYQIISENKSIKQGKIIVLK